ncbi:MAG TPA: type IIL restriction-modification enzyme MmeI [Gammaproteobacteria bacterium]|nr:type IIL restriction-modification enzyme MmeI [Gammaproteobacteria bacterium]
MDKAVDAAYGKKGFNSDAERVAFLFDLYQKYTSLLPTIEKPKHARRRSGIDR